MKSWEESGNSEWGNRQQEAPVPTRAWPGWDQPEAIVIEAMGSGVDSEHYKYSGKTSSGFKQWINTF